MCPQLFIGFEEFALTKQMQVNLRQNWRKGIGIMPLDGFSLAVNDAELIGPSKSPSA
jgi:hypothetical protein